MFLHDHLVNVEAPTATGTSTIDTTSYDMAGYEEITFIVRLGTPNANNNIRAQQDTVQAMGSAADLTGTLVTGSSLNPNYLNVRRPKEQFVRCRITRAASTTIDSVVVVRSGARNRPVTQPATAAYEVWSEPAEGTA